MSLPDSLPLEITTIVYNPYYTKVIRSNSSGLLLIPSGLLLNYFIFDSGTFVSRKTAQKTFVFPSIYLGNYLRFTSVMYYICVIQWV